jgi:hypothetical protein
LKTLATTEGGEKINAEHFANSRRVYGQFGFDSPRYHNCTFGLNEKAGMNAEEFQKYLMNSILPLYPDIGNIPGKRVLLKVDSGPGRMDFEMLAEMKAMGLLLVPGVPNSTHVTQETDQNYGPLKTGFRINIDKLTAARLKKGLTIKVTDLLLVVFGGVDELTGCELKKAFDEAFEEERNLEIWEKLGAVPLTRRALLSSGVRHELEVDADGNADTSTSSQAALLLEIEKANHYYCNLLTSFGYDGEALKLNAPRAQVKPPLTAPHSKERIEAIMKAKGTAGSLFHATGGEHINTEEFFQAAELKTRRERLKKLEGEKATRNEKIEAEGAALSMIADKGGKEPGDEGAEYNLDELRKVMLYWKIGKKTYKDGKKDVPKKVLVNLYRSSEVPEEALPWTDEEEQELQELLKGDVPDVADTQLAVAAKQAANATAANWDLLPDGTKQMLFDRQFGGALPPERYNEDGTINPSTSV